MLVTLTCVVCNYPEAVVLESSAKPSLQLLIMFFDCCSLLFDCSRIQIVNFLRKYRFLIRVESKLDLNLVCTKCCIQAAVVEMLVFHVEMGVNVFTSASIVTLLRTVQMVKMKMVVASTLTHFKRDTTLVVSDNFENNLIHTGNIKNYECCSEGANNLIFLEFVHPIMDSFQRNQPMIG